MDENSEIEKLEEKGGEKKEKAIVPSELQDKAKKEWDEANKKREERGEKISEEEKIAQRQLMEKGRGPIGGGSSDGYFEHFDPEKYKDTPLYDLGKRLKDQGLNSQVTPQTLEEIKKTAYALIGPGKISEDKGAQFLRDVNIIEVAQRTGVPIESDALGHVKPKVEKPLSYPVDLKKYSEFNENLFSDSPLSEIAHRIKTAGMGSGEDINKITQEYKDLKKELPVALQSQFDEEIIRVQSLFSNESAPKSLSEKYKDKPALLEIIRELENKKALDALDQRALDQQLQRLQQMMNDGQITLEEAKEFASDIRELSGQADRRERVQRNNITSIQDLAKIIISDEGEDRWGALDGSLGVGVYPLLEKGENGKLKINKANFIQWARERTMYHHNNNPRELQLQITQLVGVDNDFGSTISIFSMDKNRNKYFKDEESGRILDDLAEQLKTEVWLFGSMRTYDLMYKEYMGQDTKLPEFLVNVHNKEELTSGDSLERIVTLSEKFLGNDEDENNRQDTKVGDAARKAYEVYYYMSDLVKLREILGRDSIFFKKEGLINVFKIIERKSHQDDIDPVNLKQIEKLFNEDGSIKESEFIQFINPFNDQNKPDIVINVARELVRQAIAEKYDLEYGLEKRVSEELTKSGKYRAPERDFLRINTEYAETWAWILSRFTGAAARNDTNSIGFDAFTKTMQFMKYRIRQSAPGRAGQMGNEYNLGVFKSLTLDFFNGVWVRQGFDEKGRTTPFELMMQIDSKDKAIEEIKGGKKSEDLTSEQNAQISALQEEKKKMAKKFRFDVSTQKGYATNHLGRAFEIFHNMLGNEELRLDQIVKYEQFGLYQGRHVIDRTKFEEVLKEKFIKPVRYAFSTYPMIDFAKETQELVSAGGANKLPVYRTTTIAESIFGPIVTGEIKRDIVSIKKRLIKEKIERAKKDGISKDKALNDREKQLLKKRRFGKGDKEELWKEMLSGPSADLRPILWKRAVMARIARDLLSHRIRARDNKYEYIPHEQVDLFLHALENIPSIEVLENGEEELRFAYGEKFLNEEDMKWIRQQSRTTEGKLFISDVAPSVVGGFGKGILEGLGNFFKGSFK